MITSDCRKPNSSKQNEMQISCRKLVFPHLPVITRLTVKQGRNLGEGWGKKNLTSSPQVALLEKAEMTSLTKQMDS